MIAGDQLLMSRVGEVLEFIAFSTELQYPGFLIPAAEHNPYGFSFVIDGILQADSVNARPVGVSMNHQINFLIFQ